VFIVVNLTRPKIHIMIMNYNFFEREKEEFTSVKVVV